MLGLVFKHQDFDIKSQKICKQKSGRVRCIPGLLPPAGPIPLLPVYSSSFALFFVCEMMLLIFCLVTI